MNQTPQTTRLQEQADRQAEVTAVLEAIMNEAANDGKPLQVKFTDTERRILGELARAYKKPMGTVIKRLLRQAYIDWKLGEVFGLSDEVE